MKKLIIVNGLPASGKSTLAARLSKELGLPMFSKDQFKELIADTIGYTDHESTQTFGKASFAILFSVARKCLENGVSVIIEGNFSLGDETKEFLKYIKEADIETQEVLCYATPELLMRRFKERAQHPSRHAVHNTIGEIDLNDWIERTLQGDGKAAPLTGNNLLEIDTAEPTDEEYQKVAEFLR
jgi:predicted kinase